MRAAAPVCPWTLETCIGRGLEALRLEVDLRMHMRLEVGKQAGYLPRWKAGGILNSVGSPGTLVRLCHLGVLNDHGCYSEKT
jgi:hypothetical protein